MKGLSASLMAMPRIGAYTTEGQPVVKFALAAESVDPELVGFYSEFGQGKICGELQLDVFFPVIDFSKWFDWREVDVSPLSGVRSVITTCWGVLIGALASEKTRPTYVMININDVRWTVHNSFEEALSMLSAEASRPHLLSFPYYETRQVSRRDAKLRVDPAFAATFAEVCRLSFPEWLVFQETSYLGVNSRFISPSRRFVGVLRTDSTLSASKPASYRETLKDTPHIVEIIDTWIEQLGCVTAHPGDVFEAWLEVSCDVKNLKMEDLEELQTFLRAVVGGDIETSGLGQFFESL
ncbi:MAG: hypothetical protein IPK32_12780 [Verrucomicrobiaceae bacterium]|nr:hypothetical protein [Verrucomicrobiaceae bacterium]